MRTIVTFVLLLTLLVGCNDRSKLTEHATHGAETSGVKYTCPMHSQVIQDKPGNCPVCGMALVKVSAATAKNELMLTESQMRLANVTTDVAGRKPVGETVVLNGTLVVDQSRSEAITSRAAGRIEKLFVKETGQVVTRGQPLYVIYSESLLTMQREYLLAKEQYESVGENNPRYKSFLDAAQRKLLLYGITKAQIEKLNKNTVQSSITFLSPASGIVTQLATTEGQYVEEGGRLYRIEDIATLWVEAELYSDEARLVKEGDKVKVSVTGVDKPVDAVVTFLSPEFRSNTQVVMMRAEIKNSDMKFKPGQQAQVYFTHSAHDAIALPVDAVIRDGKGSHVYVQTARNTFKPKVVKTGLQSFDQVEITEGLNEGDTVAVSGAYLLYSEIILKRGGEMLGF